MNILLATVIYFLIGYITFHLVESKNRNRNIKLFSFTFFVALFACLLFYASWLLLGLESHKGVEGLFSPDSSTYYLDAAALVKSNFDTEVLNRVITDHYHELFMAIQMLIFGEHVLIPKIYQVLLFSISVVLWVSIARDILGENKMVKHFTLLLVFCIPLLSYNAVVLKEISLFFSTSVAVYGFTKYTYSSTGNNKYILIALLGIILMFLFRREYALVLTMAFILATFISSNLSYKNKSIWIVFTTILFMIISNVPFFQSIGAVDPLLEGGIIISGRNQYLEGGQGMLGNLLLIIQNPVTVGPYLIYGLLMLFFHPAFLQSPAQMLNSGGLGYLTMGYYNAFFTLLIPAFIFGVRFLYKHKKNDPVLIALLIYFIGASLGAIFASDSYRRFKISYFWPIAYVYISYGIATYSLWKRYIPIILLLFGFLAFAYYTLDIIGFAS